MKTYKITIRPIEMEIRAENIKEAKEIFWDNFDTYYSDWPTSDNLNIEELTGEDRENEDEIQ